MTSWTRITHLLQSRMLTRRRGNFIDTADAYRAIQKNNKAAKRTIRNAQSAATLSFVATKFNGRLWNPNGMV